MADEKVLDVAKESGVNDLPAKIRVKFAKALIAERSGRHEEAESFLNEAILVGMEG